MHLKHCVYFLVLIIPLVSCERSASNLSKDGPSQYSLPQTIPLNTQEGYTINSITGDSIQPVINSNGNIVVTGKPVKIEGRVIDSQELVKAKVVTAGNPQIIRANQNIYQIPQNLKQTQINKNALKSYSIDEIHSSFVLTNSLGDTIPTGVPIRARGDTVLARHTKPIEALEPRFKENTITNLKYLDVDQGLSSSRIRSITMDDNENIWFGTHGGGITCYNGESFLSFTSNEGLCENIIHRAIQDSKGNLWFGGYIGGGISVYDGTNFTNFNTQHGLNDPRIRAISEDSSGRIWIGTEGGGASVFDGNYFTHYTTREGLANNEVHAIIEDRDGKIWLGTSKGLSIFDGEKFTNYAIQDGLGAMELSALLEDIHGNIWIGSKQGNLDKYDGNSFTHIPLGKIATGEANITCIFEDKNSAIWIGTEGGGLVGIGEQNFVHYTSDEGLTDNAIFSIIEDNSGNLWIGTRDGGVNILNPSSFKYYTTRQGLNNNNIRSTLEDKNGNLWFSSWGGWHKQI